MNKALPFLQPFFPLFQYIEYAQILLLPAWLVMTTVHIRTFNICSSTSSITSNTAQGRLLTALYIYITLNLLFSKTASLVIFLIINNPYRTPTSHPGFALSKSKQMKPCSHPPTTYPFPHHNLKHSSSKHEGGKLITGSPLGRSMWEPIQTKTRNSITRTLGLINGAQVRRGENEQGLARWWG